MIDYYYNRVKPGCRVRVDGLKSAVAFNGKEGTVISFDRELGRYDVQLAEAACEEVEMLKVKRTNIVVVSGIEPNANKRNRKPRGTVAQSENMHALITKIMRVITRMHT